MYKHTLLSSLVIDDRGGHGMLVGRATTGGTCTGNSNIGLIPDDGNSRGIWGGISVGL